MTLLSDANLRYTNLSGADLRSANLRNADLTGAKAWTVKQLTSAKNLERATMPNGQKYEDWLKSREKGDSGS
jgi:uncharacterized protein YjbI with pentapeptide repeats